MATRVTINVASLIKEINKYDAKSLRRSTYQATKRIGFLVAKSDKKGLPFEFKSGKNKFRDPVDYTLKSINYAAEKNEVTFKVNDDESKGNAPAKYLFPVIGGGSTEVYATRFLQYLRKRNYINPNQYPYPNTKYGEMIQLTESGRVKPTVYRNTIWGLSSSRNKKTNSKSKGSRIHNARVFAVKSQGESKNKKLRAGIYRVKADEGKKGMVKPLFIYGKLPSIKAKDEYGKQIMTIINREFPKILNESINKYGKSS